LENKLTQGQRIRAARKAAKLTQKELADKSGISFGSIRRYESDDRIPRASDLKEIANILKIHVNDLINDQVDNVGIPNSRWYDLREKLKRKEATPEEAEEYRALVNMSINSDKMVWLPSIPDPVVKTECLIYHFDKLNDTGQDKAVEHVEDLTFDTRYKKED